MNVEGKILFSILAKRPGWRVMGTSPPAARIKAGVPGFTGCVEHSAVIWEQIQRAKREKDDLYVMWLDLANAYGSVPHQLIKFAMDCSLH